MYASRILQKREKQLQQAQLIAVSFLLFLVSAMSTIVLVGVL